MKTFLLVLILCLCAIQIFHAQEENDGVVALNLPTRNSLTLNRYHINPTFSFVREQNQFFSITNKREWVQFEDAPETYLVSFGGRFRENIGGGISLFKQNYGVLTTFGGVGNFAYNARLGRESNLTFALNISAYKSGIDGDRLTTNIADPSFNDIPSNFLVGINPGINYGMAFLDVGVSLNNFFLYNMTTSTQIEDNPEEGIQAHLMYTGFMRSNGFFDESKFSGLVRSEFKQDDTVISAMAMITVPKGIWAQVGYNTQFGVHGGLGLNITRRIAIEYNFEKALGDLTDFGPSHEISLAFRFDNIERFDYNGDEKVGAIIPNREDKAITKLTREQAKLNKKLAQEAKVEAKLKAQVAEEAKLKEEADKKAEEAAALAEQKAKEEAKALTQQLAEQKAKEEAEAQAKLLVEQRAKEEAAAQAKLLAEQKAKEEAEAQAKLLAEQRAKEEAAAQAKLLAEQKAKEEAEAQAKLLAEQRAKEEAAAQAKLLAEQKAKDEAAAQTKLLAEQKAKEEAEAQVKLLAEQKAKEEAEALAQQMAEQKAKEEAEAKAQQLAEQKAKEEAEAKANEELISNPKDEVGKSMYELAQQTEEAKSNQNELLRQFDDIVKIKDSDLKDLKEENDLSEQGIAVQPKEFKSITAENNKLEAIKEDLDDVIKTRNDKIERLKSLYDDKFEADTIRNDEVYLYYKKTIKRLTAEQLKATEAKINLESRLEDIKIATEFERRRRIKRAAFDNEAERYSQDRTTLLNIKQTTVLSETPFTKDDFDFGEKQSSNIQILKNVKNTDKGYYLILAVHSDVEKRNEFVTKVVASGRTDVDFFYDVNTSNYYIYYEKFESIDMANNALQSKGNRPYNTEMTIVKIE